MPGVSPSQTVGPFFHFALPFEDGHVIATHEADGVPLVVVGRVVDGLGAPVTDALIEWWQADPDGRFPGSEEGGRPAPPGFFGFGRVATDDEGRFVFRTVKPGSVAGPAGQLQAPHALIGVFARGMMTRVLTRLYFEDDGEVQATDPILTLVPAHRRHTLIARRQQDGQYRFDIVLQGSDETVFFDA